MILVSCFASLMLLASKLRAVADPYHIHSLDVGSLLSSLANKQDAADCSNVDSSLIIISTIDGMVSTLDARTGNLLWSMPSSSPLLSSSISSVKTLQELASLRFIPSLDGKLYQWSGTELEAIPLNADYLLGQMEKLPDGSFIVGSKAITISGVESSSGQPCYQCTSTGCSPVAQQDVDINRKDILVLRRLQQTVRVVDPRSGHERWNFSVGSYTLDYVEGSQKEIEYVDESCGSQSAKPVENIHFVVQDGIVETVESNSSDRPWRFQFQSPIAAAWSLKDEKLKPIDIFKHGILRGLLDDDTESQALMYIGIHDGQVYVQQPPATETKQRNAFSVFSEPDVQVVTQPALLHWRPFISSAPSRTPALNNGGGLTVLNELDYPFDNGFVLVADTRSVALSRHPANVDRGVVNQCRDGESGHVSPEAEESHYGDLVSLSIQDWWREILVLSVIIAVILNVAMRCVKKRLAAAVALAPCFTAEETRPVLNLRRSKGSSVSIATETEIAPSASSLPVTPTEFISSYLRDFEHLQCLGKGAFGVVFKAKKNIDDCEYAVKRIYLPHCEEAKEKMMREVRALASLDHPGIVRYFHAWWETPPAGWQLKTDKTLLLQGIGDNPSFALSQDWLLEVHSIYEDDTEELPKVRVRDKVQRNYEPLSHARGANYDPLGRRFNFDTGIEDLVSDHKEFDLLRNNEVFFPDESNEDRSFDKHVESEDSDFVVFEHTGFSRSNSNMSQFSVDGRPRNPVVSPSDAKARDYDCDSRCPDCSGAGDRKCRRTATLTPNHSVTGISDAVSIGTSASSTSSYDGLALLSDPCVHVASTKSKSKAKLVGKCCSKSADCLTAPPLFLYIQMQLCRQDTLKDWLSENCVEKVDMKYRLGIFSQIVEAVIYFHGRGMMHRDLKPANIFFSLDGSVKVGDFGLVTAITRPCAGKYKGKSFEDENHTGHVGTQLYMSPEQVTGRPYNHKVDIYSLGVIFFELLYAFSTQMERIQVIYKLKQSILPGKLAGSPEGNLVQLLLSEDPECRPDASEIGNHVYLQEIHRRLSDVATC